MIVLSERLPAWCEVVHNKRGAKTSNITIYTAPLGESVSCWSTPNANKDGFA